MRKDIYCEMSFLLKCISKLEDSISDNLESHGEYELWNAISNIIFSSKIRLHLDLEKEEYEAEICSIDKERRKAARKEREYVLTPRERVLLDINLKQQNQEIHLVLSEPNPLTRDFSLDSENQYNGIYFTCSDKELCQKKMDDYGVLVLCPDNLSEYKHVLEDEGIALHKDCSNSWDIILSDKLLPCNSMIIVDNYVLNDIDLMKDNLSQIVNALKPQILKLKIPFYITIFTTLRNDKKIDLPVDERWKILHDDIVHDIDVHVSIIKSQEDFHDRTILTNNQFIGCGYGFILFKNKRTRKTTTISVVCPFLNHSVKWAFEGYCNVIKDASIPYFAEDLNKYGDNISYCYPKFYVGDKFNRLLDKKRIEKYGE